MTAENLCVNLEDMIKETTQKKLTWHVEFATSEYQKEEEKPVVEADGKTWTVDECYTAYSCNFRGADFCMITYENIEKSGEQTRTINLVFLPPVAMRLFALDELAPYAVETSAVLVDKIHRLFDLLLSLKREGSDQVILDAREIIVKDTEE